ncbi:MAG: TonB-dependent receptor [Bryobacteraceae bacterium]|nr:TonB-dependent receptor [Bryobacteraceae bacterium]
MTETFRLLSAPARRMRLRAAGLLLLCLTLPATSAPQKPAEPDPDKPPVLEPVQSSITVIDQIETETPGYTSVITRRRLAEQPGVNIDDRLRAIPGFSLFRRSSSLVANPTTQGVSLRGLGSSGASRSLVLWDGVPLNDPFGGWVYWTRVSPAELERVEVTRGASTSVFGDRAMSGALNLFSRPVGRWGSASYEGGNRETHNLSAGGSWLVRQKWGLSSNVRAFTTDGYYIIRDDRRGRVDTPANVRFVSGNTRFDWLGDTNRLFVRLDVLAEERANGTVLTRNSTSLGTLAANYAHNWTRDTVSILGYHTREEYRATFSAVAANRNTETLTSTQQVPSEAVGAAGIWSHRGSNWSLLGGADAQRVEGVSTDRLPVGSRVGGGSQLQHGTFLQSDLTYGPLKLFLGARNQFAGSDSRFFSPSTGLVLGRGAWRARGSVYRGFRAATLNELYRPFRQGNAETLPNAALLPETLFGSEAGMDYVGETTRVAVSLFRNDLSNIITNVTLQSTPMLITRQRQNAASALSRGLDMNVRQQWRNLTGELAYLYVDSRFGSGERIPQVPRNSGTAQVTYSRRGTLASMGVRAFSLQLEDDRNLFVLPGFSTLQFAFAQSLKAGFTFTTEIENLSARQYLTGFSPVPLIGAPRLWRTGLRWDIGRAGRP